MENMRCRKPSVEPDGTQPRWKHNEVSVTFKVLASYTDTEYSIQGKFYTFTSFQVFDMENIRAETF